MDLIPQIFEKCVPSVNASKKGKEWWKKVKIMIFVLLIRILFAGNALGFPLIPVVINYTTENYHASNQNWSIRQDRQGRIYIGNTKGLLEFDGFHWELYSLPNNTILRAIYITEDDRIYVGSYEEFGYFVRNVENQLEYTSLKSKIPDYYFYNDEVWNIVEYQGKIFFQTFSSYFVYDGTNVTGIKSRPLNFLLCHGKVYSQSIVGGFNGFDGEKFTEIIENKRYNKDKIVAILPERNNYILVSQRNGLFIYSQESGTITPLETSVDDELKVYSVNKAIMTKDSCYVLGTVSNGLYAVDRDGKIQWKINSENGLCNNTIQNLFCDAENNVWAATENGIAQIQHRSPTQVFMPGGHNFGTPNDVLIKSDKVYVASVQGLFCYDRQSDKLNLIKGTEGIAYSIREIDGQLICGHNFGTFRIENNKATRMPSVVESISIQKCRIHNQEILLQNTYSDLVVYRKNIRDEWAFSHRISDFHHLTAHIEIDHQDNLWVQHMHRGMFRLKLNEDLSKTTDIKYYAGLNGKANIKINILNVLGRIVFSDGCDFYTYEDLTDSIVPYKQMNEDLPDLRDTYRIVRINSDTYWFINNIAYNLVKYSQGHFRIEQQIPFSSFKNPPMDNLGNVAFDHLKNSYLYLDGALAKYNPEKSSTCEISGTLSIKNIAVYEANQQPVYIPLTNYNKIPYSHNNVIVSLSYPIKGNKPFTIEYTLENHTIQANISGSFENEALQKEYSRLPAGKYRFRAEVLDGHNILSEINYHFEIQNPFYLSELALAIYFLLFIFFLAFIYYLINKRKNKVIEQQKQKHAAEIEKQQKQIVELENRQLASELRFKSKELAGFTMLNIKNKEFLIRIREELQQQKTKGQTSKMFLEKIIKLIDRNISSGDDWNIFQSNFDRIHENFFRNLKTQYPNLTPNDLRLCALLRLNLSTKDICNVMNLSIRGIEGARLRLRKRLNIPPDKNLVDFMIEFK